MRDYSNIDKYLTDLFLDIYPQAGDLIHKNQTRAVFYTWIIQLIQGEEITNALDIGCGQGVAYPFFRDAKLPVIGITLGNDVKFAKQSFPDFDVREMDMHFLEFEDEHFDFIYARHILEHSPMPLLALMECRRVCKPDKYAVIVVPHHENVVQGGINHYYMLNPIQWKVLFKRANWEVLKEDYSDPSEHRFLLKRL